MLLTRRMEERGLKPIGFVSNDYALGIYEPGAGQDPRSLFSSDILDDEFIAWVEESSLLKRAFRDVAVISGLIERQQPGARKTSRQVSFSTDLIYDVLRRYEPDHLLLKAAWADARARMTDVGRLGELLDRAAGTIDPQGARPGEPPRRPGADHDRPRERRPARDRECPARRGGRRAGADRDDAGLRNPPLRTRTATPLVVIPGRVILA